MVAHKSSTLLFDVTMVGPRLPQANGKRKSDRFGKLPVFAGYHVAKELASGGMGTVFEAYHRKTGARVAIKTLRCPSRQRDLERRFLGEVVASRRIGHPSVVNVFDFGHDKDGHPYLIMEYLDGEPLSERVRKDDLSVDEFCAVATQLASVVAAAHRAGVLHRDIKPSNVIVSNAPAAQGGGIQVKLIDFGIAKFVAGDAFVSGNTQAGILMGTPAYMSPEQCLGGELDERSDIYALGCLLFELLTGRCPFVGSVGDVLVAQRLREAPPVASLNPAVPPRLARLVDRMLSKRPTLRPQTMEDVACELALLECDRRGPPPRPVSSSYAAIPRRIDDRQQHPRRWRRRLANTALGLTLGLAATAAGVLFAI